MLYARLTPVARNQWDVVTPVKSTKPIANVQFHRNGHCSVKIYRALSHEELDTVHDFMHDLENEAAR